MNFGVCLPHYGKDISLGDLRGVAQDAEAMGYHSVWASDHIVTPAHLQPNFGSTFFDAFVTLSHVSALTQRVKLGTTVMVVPYRNPLVSAKIISSLDALSGGRVILGVGAGGAPDEFEALGVPNSERGRRTDEYLRVMLELWSNDPANFQGRFFNFRDVRFAPKPEQKPHPPIWVGGRSDAALIRAVRFGQAWHPTNMAWDRLRERMDALAQFAADAGTNPGPEVTMHQIVALGDDPVSGERRLGHGSPGQVAEDLHDYVSLGIETVVCNFRSAGVSELKQQIERFAAQIMPQLASPN